MSLLNTIVAFIVALGVLIVVHEFGHYLVARLCGVKVLRFSVGFGRRLAGWHLGKDRTEWMIAAIPFGGYVKMLDEREAPVEPAELPRAFNRQSVWRRFAIVAAGPLFNFLFAIAAYSVLYMYGLPEARPVLAEPAAGTLAKSAGFRADDLVTALDGKAVVTWQDLRFRLLQSAVQRDLVAVDVVNPKGQIATHRLDFKDYQGADLEQDVLERIGMRLARPRLDPVIGEVDPGGAARRAGLLPGDRVTHARGAPIATWEAFVQVVQQNAETPLRLSVVRDGRSLEIDVVPEAAKAGERRIGRIGTAPRDVERYYLRVQHGFFESIPRAAEKTWDVSVFILKMLGKMLVGEVSWKNLSGPVTIADFAGQSAQMGWISYVTFLALISISLGVLNLLPIPLLDGGHLMYYGIEIVKGSPVSDRAMEFGQRVGLALLLVMMAFAFYNDLNRLFAG